MIDGFDQRVLDRLLKDVGERVTGILDTTREKVQNEVRQGLAEGLSPAQLGDRIEQAAAFDEYRAELIARTETATLLNQAAIASYQEFGVEMVTVIDGDDDEICASVNGQEWTLAQAQENPLGHPNCTRDFAPIIGQRAPQPASDPFSSVENRYDFSAGANEQFGIIDRRTGEVVESGTGQAGGVSFDHRGGPNYALTHSHPDNVEQILNPRGRDRYVFDGASFSDADVRTAIERDFGLMRAASREYIHELERPEGGWPKWEKVRPLYREVGREIRDEVDAEVMAAIEAGDRELADRIRTTSDAEVPHRIWQRLADEYGLPYKRTRR